ncbi:MAG: hypothetical protein GX307_04055 [Euryarchaeota archaeon]|nr:hypothetical protein [Euryarchaeota archaeon]
MKGEVIFGTPENGTMHNLYYCDLTLPGTDRGTADITSSRHNVLSQRRCPH